MHRRLLPDVAGTVAARPANLVGTGRTAGRVAEVDDEPLVEFHPPLLGVDVRLQHQRSLLANFGVELVVPRGEQGGGPVEPPSVTRQLEHLGGAPDVVTRNLLSVAEIAAGPHLIHQSGIARITDVVHPHVTVQPVREEHVLVVERQEDVGHETGDRHVPVRMLTVLDVDHLLPLPVSVIPFPEPDDVRGERGTHVSLRLLWIVRHPDLQWDQPLLAKGERLAVFLGFPVPDVDAVAVLAGLYVLQIETRVVGLWRRPLRRKHNAVPRLVPVVIVHFHGTAVALPVAIDGEVVLVELEETAGELAVGIAQHTDDDFSSRNAVDGVGCREVVLEHFLGFDYLLDCRLSGIGGVDDVNSRGALAGDDQVVAGQSFGVARRRTGVPAEVVEFVTFVRHLNGVDQLGIGVGIGVHIDDTDEVWTVDVHPDPGRHDKGSLLAFRFRPHRRRCRIAWPLYLVVFMPVCLGRLIGLVGIHGSK